MREYKKEVTLNEKQTLIDLLNSEKALVKLYATVITESVSKGVRTALKTHLRSAIEDQISVFFLMTELDYVRVKTASEDDRRTARELYKKEIDEVIQNNQKILAKN